MGLGKITGKSTTNHFSFKAETEVKKYEFVQLSHKSYGDVLCQITEIENTKDDILAKCAVIGYKDEEGKIKQIRIPFDIGTEINLATDEFIKKIILLKDPSKGAYLGKLDGKNIDIRIDLSTVLTKHVAILAKSGAGKSYTVGVLIEEILSHKVPLLIIDPHGEYSEMKNPNDDEKERLESYGLKPKGFKNIKEYGDININPELKPLKLDDTLTASEAIQLLPGKPTGTQMGILYNAIKHVKKINFTNILEELEREDNNAKWTLINSLEYIKSLELFSEIHVSYNEMVSTGVASIINLKGVPPDVQEIIVYKLLKDLFELRKQNKVPPFFTVIEEAHNYCPERSFGETKCSKIIRTIASEGRKFGLGICIVSQRPAKVDKSVVSQCTTQFIMKVTNPNDLKSISSSVEGVSTESEDEIKNLTIGTAMITGITDMPLLVKVRPRMTRHGGRAVNIMDAEENGSDDGFLEKIEDFKDLELVSLIKPKISLTDLKVMNPDFEVSAVLVPAYLFSCKEKEKEFFILCEMENGEVVVDAEEFETKKLPRLQDLSPEEIKVLKYTYTKKSFTEEDVIKKGLSLDTPKIIKDLVKKSLVIKKGSEFSLSQNYIFSQLSKNACIHKTEVDTMNKYKEKKEKKVRLDTMKAELSRFTDVLDQHECHIVKYEMEKASRKKKESEKKPEERKDEKKTEDKPKAAEKSLVLKSEENKNAVVEGK